MIAIVNYGMGNIGSIENMLKKIGVKEVAICNDKDKIISADKLILPGVGSFDVGMCQIKKSGLKDYLDEAVLDKKKPILGICLGMQLLGKSSEEGKMAGLGYVDFCNVRFKSDKIGGLKVPHMGWDYVKIIDKNNSLVKEVEGEQRYYFVHSYHAVCNEGNNILMECEYGYPFVAAINRDNIYGVQFHPEKSHKFGMKLLKNFVEEC